MAAQDIGTDHGLWAHAKSITAPLPYFNRSRRDNTRSGIFSSGDIYFPGSRKKSMFLHFFFSPSLAVGPAAGKGCPENPAIDGRGWGRGSEMDSFKRGLDQTVHPH